MESKIKSYDGSGEVKVFLEKISLHSALKGFDGEKAALYLASKARFIVKKLLLKAKSIKEQA